ncbi:PREDICTED: triadin [Crocodylus porosus]|uniref:triadin n=1 Tax=Crocodylus porosus TaxID=8502 RepID=UPI00093CCAA5|nr:PREDICTED: triadin [Crocodylus porosus]
MAEITTEGHMSTTTTIINGKNGSVLTPPVKVAKKSVTEDIVTTFSSPAAWLLVVALVVTWSAVAIVMFDLVDYRTLAGKSVNKLSKEPLRIVYETVEESTDWIYGFISFLTDIIWNDDDDSDEGEVEPPLKKKGEIHPPTKKKEIHRDKPEREEKLEKRVPTKVTHKDKPARQEKPEKKEKPIVAHKEKPEKPAKLEKPEKPIKLEKPEKREKLEKPEKREKPEKPVKLEKSEKREKQEEPEKKVPPKVTQKDKPEKPEKVERKPPPKEEKKAKSIKAEEKVKKEMKDGKPELKMPEKVKRTEIKVQEVGLIEAKPKVKEEKAFKAETRSEKKDQYAFCRYVIDMFAQRDFYTGPRLLLEQSPRKIPAVVREEKPIVIAKEVKKTEEEKRVIHERRVIPETKKKEKEEKKEKVPEKPAVLEKRKAVFTCMLHTQDTTVESPGCLSPTEAHEGHYYSCLENERGKSKGLVEKHLLLGIEGEHHSTELTWHCLFRPMVKMSERVQTAKQSDKMKWNAALKLNETMKRNNVPSKRRHRR